MATLTAAAPVAPSASVSQGPRAPAAYPGRTENMLVVPAVRPSERAAGRDFAACADRVDLVWVPDREELVVPDEMRQLCLDCPLRAACLEVAIATGSQGYWAGMTTNDRRRWASAADRQGLTNGALLAAMDVAVEAAVSELEQRAAADAAAALHPPGQGGKRWYRRKCRCRECRRWNAENRARQRARAREQLEQTVTAVRAA